ncbi:MAG: hypothetical protein KGM24_04760 [Elusimicrobia bacterium]|nr:hypothetical protein [Elusimicrobiota bacterium]
MRPALALLVLLAAAPARAGTASFGIGRFMEDPPPVVSADGWHFAVLGIRRGELVEDGRVIVENVGPAKMTTDMDEHSDRYGDYTFALSRDGRVLAYPMQVRARDGSVLGQGMGINGSEVGGVYRKVVRAWVSPGGANAAFLVETEKGFGIVSAQGNGPVFPEQPTDVFAADGGIVYLIDWQGRKWVYRDHKPQTQKDYRWLVESPDLRRSLGAVASPAGKQRILLDGKTVGAWPIVTLGGFSGDGRRYFVIAGDGASGSRPDLVVADGAVHRSPPGAVYAAFSPDGELWWYCYDGNKTTVFRAGRPVGSWPGDTASLRHWIAFSPDGRHWAALVGLDLIVDGTVAAKDVPPAPKTTRLVFDSDNELHYLASTGFAGGYVSIVCATLDGSSAEKGACAAKFAAIYGGLASKR